MKIQFLIPSESLCSENINMTNLNYIIENLNGRFSCDLFSNNGLERPFEIALILFVQGRSGSFLLWVHAFTFGEENLTLTLPLITSHL